MLNFTSTYTVTNQEFGLSFSIGVMIEEDHGDQTLLPLDEEGAEMLLHHHGCQGPNRTGTGLSRQLTTILRTHKDIQGWVAR